MNTDIESKSGLSIPFRIQRANLPSRFRIREKCFEPNRGRDEVGVSFNFDRNTVLITNKMRFRCFGVLIDLGIINIVKLLLWNNNTLALYLVCSNVSASPIAELNRIWLGLVNIERRTSPISWLENHSFTASQQSGQRAQQPILSVSISPF
jgi:hypothetical protein